MNLTDTNYHYTITEKTKLIVYLILDEIKSFNLKNEHLEKKSPKSEKKKKTILHLITTFHNVALKIETSFKLQRCLSPL